MSELGEHSLQLPLFRSRGPWPGTGRPPGPNARVRHERRPDFPGRFPAHVTLKVRRGLRTLRDVRIVRAIYATLAEACERGGFRVAEYSIRPTTFTSWSRRKTGEPSGGG